MFTIKIKTALFRYEGSDSDNEFDNHQTMSACVKSLQENFESYATYNQKSESKY